MKKKRRSEKECVVCGEDISGRRGDYCPDCKAVTSPIRIGGELETLLGTGGFRARRLPPGYSDNPSYFGDE